MKRASAGAPLTALALLVMLVPGVAAEPRIVLDAETVQGGEVLRGRKAEVEFVYRNEGDEPLRILRAKPG